MALTWCLQSVFEMPFCSALEQKQYRWAALPIFTVTKCHGCVLLHCVCLDFGRLKWNRSGVAMMLGVLALSFGPCHGGFQRPWAAGGHEYIPHQSSFGRRAVVWFGQALVCSAKYVRRRSGRICEDIGTHNNAFVLFVSHFGLCGLTECSS